MQTQSFYLRMSSLFGNVLNKDNTCWSVTSSSRSGFHFGLLSLTINRLRTPRYVRINTWTCRNLNEYTSRLVQYLHENLNFVWGDSLNDTPFESIRPMLNALQDQKHVESLLNWLVKHFVTSKYFDKTWKCNDLVHFLKNVDQWLIKKWILC